jgi:hypothetical protein
MNFWHAIRRLISVSWLVAAPLVIVLLLIGVLIFFEVFHGILKLLFGLEEADTIFMDVMMWGAELVFVLTPIGLAIYGVIFLARWLVGKKRAISGHWYLADNPNISANVSYWKNTDKAKRPATMGDQVAGFLFFVFLGNCVWKVPARSALSALLPA